MSNVGHRLLIKFGKSSVYNGLCGISYKETQFLHTSTLNCSESRTAKPNHEDQSKQTRSSYSSNHQFHRHSYERKRTDYQKDRARHKHRTEPLISNSEITHYQRLSVVPESDTATIKSAYYALSKQYHPDVVGKDSPDAAEQFRLITESYDILSNPTSRKEYDSTLSLKTQSPQFTSWQPSQTSTKEQDHIFRMREASRIIRTKQDTFLESEKLKNPHKFRAGTFKVDVAPVDPRAQLNRLDRQIQSLNDNDPNYSDGSNFYRMHLVDTIRRRREDLLMYREHQAHNPASDGVLVTSILTVIGGLAFFTLVVVNQFFDIDLAAALDGKLDHAFEEVKVLKRKE